MSHYVREISSDLVVIGGGGGGLVAAVRAAQQSGKKVVLLEKTKRLGGSASMAVCMRTFESKWQEKRGLDSHTLDYIRAMQDQMQWKVDPKLAWNSVMATGKFVDWAMELDPSLDDKFFPGTYMFGIQDIEPVGPQTDRKSPKGLGALFMETMENNCKNFGVEVLTEHPAVDVEVENGKITAVIAEGPEGEIRVTCRACIIATGSWINNTKVVERVCPEYLDAWTPQTPHSAPYLTGDAIDFAEKVGAFVDYDNFVFRFMGDMTLARAELMRAMMNSNYPITVNLNGKRFCSEPLSRLGAFEDGPIQFRQPHAASFRIFDTNILTAAFRQGNLIKHNYDERMLDYLPKVASDEAGLQKQLEEAFAGQDAGKEIFRADTLEELAAMTGIDRNGLLETVRVYNESCENGVDWEFVRPTDSLVPLVEGPYYAIRIAAATDGAFGGILVNADMQAYKADKSGLVEGLFAVGDFTCGRYAVIGGLKRQILNDLAWAFASGFIAGNKAAEYIK